MNRTQLISLFFLALLAFVIYQVGLIFSPFFQCIFWAMLLSFGFYPAYEKLRGRLKGRKTLASALMTTIIFFVVVPPIILLIVNITQQAIDLSQTVTDYVRQGHLEHLIDRIRSISLIQRVEANVFQWEPIKENMTAWVINSFKSLTNSAVTQVGVITKNLFFITVNLVLTLFLVFVLLKDGNDIYDFIYQIAPLEEKNKEAIFKEVTGTFSAVIRGQILTSLTQAILAGLIFWIIGLPAPIFFAAATFIATLIPVIGAVGVWLPFVVYLITIQAYIKAAVLLVFGAGIISLVDNLMKPALIGEKTKLPYFLLFFGILGGLTIYGLIGVFLAPVILAIFFALVKIYREEFLERTT